MMKNFYSAIGKMRSAREGKIRDEFEFLHELFAQYIITGDVSFLPLQREFKISRDLFKFNGTDYDLQIQDSSLEDLATALKEMFETALYSCVGKIFVM
jgi:hypothetical protein